MELANPGVSRPVTRGRAAGPFPRTRETMPPETVQALREIALATSAVLEVEEIARILRERAPPLLGAEHAGVFAEDTEELPSAVAGLLREAARTGEARTLSGGAGAWAAAVAVPLRHGAEVHGLLLAGWREPRPLPGETVALAEMLGVHAAVALHHARLHAETTRSTLARNRFFSAMSHDLRTPIAAIVGYAELLSDGIVGDLSEKQQEMVERISQVAAQLSELVDGILDLAKLDAGRVDLHPEALALEEAVREAVRVVAPQADAKGLPLRLALEEACGHSLRADPVRLRQILVNLLSNAVKFTDQGEVTVSAGVREARTWIRVRDTGPGLPEGSEEAVFEEFVRLASGRGGKRDAGSGLGLAVSRRLAQAMGGELVAESSPGAGAAFTLYLPGESPVAPGR
jgi:signal transduction histidine kinase